MRTFIALCCLCLLTAAPAGGGPLWPLDQWPQPVAPASRPPDPVPTPTDPAGRLIDQVRDLATALVDSIDEGGAGRALLDEGLAVTTFVELKKLDRSSSFGRYLADQLLTEFQQRGFRVVELRKSDAILVAARHGEHLLSRDPNLLQPAIEAGAIVTGTYTPTPAGILVNARIVGAADGVLLASAVRTIPRNELVDFLLADRSSASRANRQPIYVKELQ